MHYPPKEAIVPLNGNTKLQRWVTVRTGFCQETLPRDKEGFSLKGTLAITGRVCVVVP